jgi:hypothetical protein
LIQQKGAGAVTVHVTAHAPTTPTREGLDGFIEANHYVSIDAAHFTRETEAGGARWVNLPDYGETVSAMTVFPVTAASLLPPQAAPTLEYRMYLFDSGKASAQAILAPTLNFVPGRGLRYAISFDEQPPVIVDALADDSPQAWAAAVSDGVRKVTTLLHVASPGYHTLKVRMIDPGVVLEKLVVGFADPHAPRFPGTPPPAEPTVPASYLGPPESYYRMPSSEARGAAGLSARPRLQRTSAAAGRGGSRLCAHPRTGPARSREGARRYCGHPSPPL